MAKHLDAAERDLDKKGVRSSIQRDEAADRARVQPVVVRSVRNAHGTRVFRRIQCTRCGADDAVVFAPRKPSTILCRRCAFEVHGAIDADDPGVRRRKLTCTVCSGEVEVVVSPVNDKPCICTNCRLGIETQQDSRSLDGVRVSKNVVRARRTKTRK